MSDMPRWFEEGYKPDEANPVEDLKRVVIRSKCGPKKFDPCPLGLPEHLRDPEHCLVLHCKGHSTNCGRNHHYPDEGGDDGMPF